MINKNKVKEYVWKFINKWLGKHCQKCGKKKYNVRRYKGVCSKCFHKHKYKQLGKLKIRQTRNLKNQQLRKLKVEEKRLKHKSHQILNKIIRELKTNYPKTVIYKWLEHNTNKGHFSKMDITELKDAIKKLKKYRKQLKKTETYYHRGKKYYQKS